MWYFKKKFAHKGDSLVCVKTIILVERLHVVIVLLEYLIQHQIKGVQI